MDLSRGVEDAGIPDVVLLEVADGRPTIVLEVDPEELDVGPVAACGRVQRRRLVPARPAPGCPQVHDDGRTPELEEETLVAREVERGKGEHARREQLGGGRVRRARARRLPRRRRSFARRCDQSDDDDERSHGAGLSAENVGPERIDARSHRPDERGVRPVERQAPEDVEGVARPEAR